MMLMINHGHSTFMVNNAEPMSIWITNSQKDAIGWPIFSESMFTWFQVRAWLLQYFQSTNHVKRREPAVPGSDSHALSVDNNSG